ncbi:MAG: FAD-dependent oxidoreductase [Candidatus Andersenbacteria bacterium]|nr:FAD-dependent oxidoreductase [Candidatus Andersenbacteria bacterium]
MASKDPARPARSALIIGAGPAGLTAAHELLARSDIHPIVVEESGDTGGISRTVNYKGNRMDIGGHRFFSKSDRVMDWWMRVLPCQKLDTASQILSYQGQSHGVAIGTDGPDPQTTDKVMLLRQRKSRIYYLRQFFDYPIRLSVETLWKLGLPRTVRIGLSYIKSTLFPLKPESNLEAFFINRFGRELYRTFFESYTQKVWGLHPSGISAEWGAQRVKGLSITKAVWHFLKTALVRQGGIRQKGTETSLIDQFLYPKLGPGQMWEEVARQVKHGGSEIRFHTQVVSLRHDGGRVVAAEVKDTATGALSTIQADFVISSMPIKTLVLGVDPPAPAEIQEIARGLVYRDFITMGLLVTKLQPRPDTKDASGRNLIPDNWVYIQEPDVRIGRLQVFNNWSPWLVSRADTVWLGLEYFCNEGDDLWSMSDEEFSAFAIKELETIRLIDRADVLDYTVVRVPKTYPAYYGTYDRFPILRDWVNGLDNLFCVGRNGMHRYNNQDHSMLTAMEAVTNILQGQASKDNLWEINTEMEYHEEKKVTGVESVSEGLLDSGSRGGYVPDTYWEKTHAVYPYYPTVRHRKRFLMNTIGHLITRAPSPRQDVFIWDYGCGEGGVLKEMVDRFALKPQQTGGCDVSEVAIGMAKENLPGVILTPNLFPSDIPLADIINCSELIEHTTAYSHILLWMFQHLKPGGFAVLTTQTGRIHASDRYTGHTQHFQLEALETFLVQEGFDIVKARKWGWPFFTAQKYLTDFRFSSIQNSFLEGSLNWRKKAVFWLAHLAFYVHDAIPFGPQLYVVVRKPAGGSHGSKPTPNRKE